jgi:hypothetical protein
LKGRGRRTGDDDDLVLDSGLAGTGGDLGNGREELRGESLDAILGFGFVGHGE